MTTNQDVRILAPSTTSVTRFAYSILSSASARQLIAHKKFPVKFQLATPSDRINPYSSGIFYGNSVRDITLEELMESYLPRDRYVQFINKSNGVRKAAPLSREFNPYTLASKLRPIFINYVSVLTQAVDYVSINNDRIFQRENKVPFVKSLSNLIGALQTQCTTMMMTCITGIVEGFLIADHTKTNININYVIPSEVSTSRYAGKRGDFTSYTKERHTYRNTLAVYTDLFAYVKLHLYSLIECCLQQEHERSFAAYSCVTLRRLTSVLKSYVLELQKYANEFVDVLYADVFADMDIVQYLRDKDLRNETHVCTLLPAIFHYFMTGNYSSLNIQTLLRTMPYNDDSIPDCETGGFMIKSSVLTNLLGDSIFVSSPRETFNSIRLIDEINCRTYGYHLVNRIRFSWPLVTNFDSAVSLNTGGDCAYGRSNLLAFIVHHLGPATKKDNADLNAPTNRLRSIPFNVTPELVHMWLTAVYLTSFAQIDYTYTNYSLSANRNLRYSTTLNSFFYRRTNSSKLNLVRVSTKSHEIRVKDSLEVDLYAVKSILTQ